MRDHPFNFGRMGLPGIRGVFSKAHEGSRLTFLNISSSMQGYFLPITMSPQSVVALG
jgi:hypothetical protein